MPLSVRMCRVVAVLGLVACGDKDTADTGQACADAPTWEGFAEGYVTTWCLPCHNAELTGKDRQGAPETINFDSWSEVYQWRLQVLDRSVNDPVSPMPPLGGVPATDVALFAQWLECGALGQDEPPDACATSVSGGTASIGNQAEADVFCAAYNTADVLAIQGNADLSCLCSVGGDLSITGGAVELPALGSVGGSLSISADATSVHASALEVVGGDVTVDGAAALNDLLLPALGTVGGDVVLQGLDALPLMSFDYLRTVGGMVLVQQNDALETLDLPRLYTTGGDLVLQDLPELTSILGTGTVDAVGGSLILQRLPSLIGLNHDSFTFLVTVGQDLIVSDNDILGAVDGFALLTTVPGLLAIEDNPFLQQINGFDNVTTVGGDLRIRDNPVQQHVLGLYNLSTVGGNVVLENLFSANAFIGFDEVVSVGGLRLAQVGEVDLADWPLLETVLGDLTITGMSKMTSLSGMPVLTSVGGDLSVTDNEDLASITGLQQLLTVGGSALISDNPLLPTTDIEEWLAAVVVSGTVTVEDNG